MSSLLPGHYAAVKLRKELYVTLAPGIIPACAGSTNDVTGGRLTVAGSSPHARGTPGALGGRPSAPRDHPRMRGEHRDAPNVAVRLARIISACAGITKPRVSDEIRKRESSPHARGARGPCAARASGAGDHPPMRGEHRSPTRCSSSSGRIIPRMRGEHSRPRVSRSRASGIIPACAGSTLHTLRAHGPTGGSSPHARGAPTRSSAATPTRRDHPRMRGEHLHDRRVSRPHPGIIPACAGSTKVSVP